MKTSEKNLAMAAILIALIAVLLAVAAIKGVKFEGVGTGNPQTVVGSTSGGTGATSTLGLSYNDAVDLYGTYRFQFSACHGTPGSISIRHGVTFMLDNRDAKAHTIKVGTATYSVGAYGFRVAAAPAKAGTYNITCDGGGAASLNVE